MERKWKPTRKRGAVISVEYDSAMAMGRVELVLWGHCSFGSGGGQDNSEKQEANSRLPGHPPPPHWALIPLSLRHGCLLCCPFILPLGFWPVPPAARIAAVHHPGLARLLQLHPATPGAGDGPSRVGLWAGPELHAVAQPCLGWECWLGRCALHNLRRCAGLEHFRQLLTLRPPNDHEHLLRSPAPHHPVSPQEPRAQNPLMQDPDSTVAPLP